MDMRARTGEARPAAQGKGIRDIFAAAYRFRVKHRQPVESADYFAGVLREMRQIALLHEGHPLMRDLLLAGYEDIEREAKRWAK